MAHKKATLTGSVSSVSGEDIKKVSAANLSNTLAGKTAGIIANTRSGELWRGWSRHSYPRKRDFRKYFSTDRCGWYC